MARQITFHPDPKRDSEMREDVNQSMAEFEERKPVVIRLAAESVKAYLARREIKDVETADSTDSVAA